VPRPLARYPGESQTLSFGTPQAVLTRERATARCSARDIATFLIAFGAAASPDLTILPVFLAAGALGAGALVVFACVVPAQRTADRDRRGLAGMVREAGIGKDARLHDARHTAGTLLAEQGAGQHVMGG
jgi:hypothetical protein